MLPVRIYFYCLAKKPIMARAFDTISRIQMPRRHNPKGIYHYLGGAMGGKKGVFGI